MHNKKNNELKSYLLLAGLLLSLSLGGCIPNPKLRQNKPASLVTGPLEQFFPNNTKPSSAAIATIKPKAGTAEPAPANVPPMGDIKVALLLPLTGGAAAIAQDMQDAAMLAVYDSASRIHGGYTVTLLPKDDAASPSVAATMAKQAIAEGAQVIIGPLFSQSVDTVKQVSGSIPIITLSNNSVMKSENCFIYGITPEQEAARAVSYGVAEGKINWTALFPNNDYGIKLETALASGIKSKGGQIVAMERYVESKHGMKTAVDRLVKKIKLGRVDALFLGDNRADSAYILKLLKEQDIDLAAISMFGTSQWHDDTQNTYPELKGGIYATTNQRAFDRYAKRFRATSKREPSYMSAIAYDAVMVVAEIAGNGKLPSRVEFLARDTVQGTAAGPYRFEPDGSVARSLALYRLTENSKEIVENGSQEF